MRKGLRAISKWFAGQGLEPDIKESLGDVHTAPARHVGSFAFGASVL